MTDVRGTVGGSGGTHRLGIPGALGALLVLFLLAGTAERVAAQEGAARDTLGDPFPSAAEPRQDAPGLAEPGLLVELSAAILAPLSDLTPSSGEPLEGSVGPNPQVSSAVGLSGGATYFLGSRLGVGVRGTWTPVDVDDQVPTGGDRSLEGELGDADFVAASVEAVIRPLPRPVAGLLSPYLALGGGVRHLSFDFDDPRLEDETDPMGTVAAGIRTSLGRKLHWSVEFRDYISKFRAVDAGSKFQNDFQISVGFGVGGL